MYHTYSKQGEFPMTKQQGGMEWHYTRPFHITSTLAHNVTPRKRQLLSETQAFLLCISIGITLLSDDDNNNNNKLMKDGAMSTLELRQLGK